MQTNKNYFNLLSTLHFLHITTTDIALWTQFTKLHYYVNLQKAFIEWIEPNFSERRSKNRFNKFSKMTFNSFQIVFHTKDIGKSKMKEKDAKSWFIYYFCYILMQFSKDDSHRNYIYEKVKFLLYNVQRQLFVRQIWCQSTLKYC